MYPNERSTPRRCTALCAEADLMSEPGLGGVLVVLEGFGDGSEVRPCYSEYPVRKRPALVSHQDRPSRAGPSQRIIA